MDLRGAILQVKRGEIILAGCADGNVCAHFASPWDVLMNLSTLAETVLKMPLRRSR